ncbi:Decaprenyl diphosphate synthase-like protein [Lineolata rhizophorae]|uniref:ditrans,polycis-polyprenyl diphosphate synthase [(2E,6E)-farnesyldiphosphate specific] n=1 Tax=Lineolata rhizophorae TaxID=578093 RepID=A0A6A6P6V7_9PEZI|nr:Decaprenyl diphosphate synthase-like protein [Lineolata rhizophorae]
MVGARDAALLRQPNLPASEREQILKNILPPAPSPSDSKSTTPTSSAAPSREPSRSRMAGPSPKSSSMSYASAVANGSATSSAQRHRGMPGSSSADGGRPESGSSSQQQQQPQKLPPKRIPGASIASKSSRTGTRGSGNSIANLIKALLHTLLFALIHSLFSVYVRGRRAWRACRSRFLAVMYYHHRTPELIRRDVSRLERLPAHLSVVLDLDEDERSGAGLEGLVGEVSEVAAWCACAGVNTLSIYERTGILKSYIPQTHRVITATLQSYFGRSRTPSLSLRTPHQPSYSPPASSSRPSSAHSTASTPNDAAGAAAPDSSGTPHLTVLLLSADDGRGTIVDLTKTLAEMAQRGKLAPADISSELVDAELEETVMGEPDLLVLFGPDVKLDGYPPWQVRLTEIFHVPDNKGVGYQVFLQALYSFAKAQMRFGR